ncbi:MAG: GAF domain-containing protein [Desulfobacteraceae bacterium]|nr:GAF domain-containing protein [Desulfobacteraceae bacterium]
MASILNTVGSDKQVHDLTVILELNTLMAAEKNLDSLLKVIMDGTTKVLNADVSSIFLCDHVHNEFYSRYIQKAGSREIRFPLDKGIAGSVRRTKKTVNIEDAYKDSRFNPDVDKETNYHTKTILCMPLITREGNVIGVTQVLNKKDGVFTEYDEKLLGVFSHQATISIENTLLYEENESLFKSLISTLSKTIDARDPVTAGHSQRVALYAAKLARACNLSTKALNEMDVASFLHDIGKIGVRDDVLLKKDHLTSEEYKKIQGHALYTSEILEQIHFSRELKNVPFLASSHHERLDGKGYPYGLHENELPISAKILAIVDVYDALTAYDRPYKKAMPTDKALSILKEGKGTQFDAKLVDLFIKEKCYNIERRQHQRVSVDLQFEIVFLSNDDQEYYLQKYGPPETEGIRNIRMEDQSDLKKMNHNEQSILVKAISKSGMQFETGYYFPTDNFVTVKIIIKSINLSVLSRVVRIKYKPVGIGYIMSVEFLNMKTAEQNHLLNYINLLSPVEKQASIRFP